MITCSDPDVNISDIQKDPEKYYFMYKGRIKEVEKNMKYGIPKPDCFLTDEDKKEIEIKKEKNRKEHNEYKESIKEQYRIKAEQYERRCEAISKNIDLISSYERFKKSMCYGIGQRRIKLMLNNKIKAGDILAELYKTALETENANINAKKYRNTLSCSYKDVSYNEKRIKLFELIGLCNKYNEHNDSKIIYGWERSDNYSANTVIYFDLPKCEQISFHINLNNDERISIPEYYKEWDGKVNSTIWKLESAISETYKDDIEKLLIKYKLNVNN